MMPALAQSLGGPSRMEVVPPAEEPPPGIEPPPPPQRILPVNRLGDMYYFPNVREMFGWGGVRRGRGRGRGRERMGERKGRTRTTRRTTTMRLTVVTPAIHDMPNEAKRKLKYHLIYTALNAVAIITVAGGVVMYFKAYPVSVQYVNQTTCETKEIAVSEDTNPAPGLCLRVSVPFCIKHKVPYIYTTIDNGIGLLNQRVVSLNEKVYNAIVGVRCYELAPLFLCSMLVPKCGPDGQVVPPCRRLCFETMRRCGYFFWLYRLTLPENLDCNFSPEMDDPNVCIGHKEVTQAELRFHRQSCTGFQCDLKRCIPSYWRCDGHVDCGDESDELNCTSCAPGMLHCGKNRCISQILICDGDANCPFGQDETNCLRLSERMGDEGHGRLEIFQSDLKTWRPACTKNWDEESSPNEICDYLGYSEVNSSQLSYKRNGSLAFESPQGYNLSIGTQEKRSILLKELRSCPRAETYPTVNLVCMSIVCGRRQQPNPQPSTRIIGGAASTPGDWPFLAAVVGYSEEIFYCAGVLISDQWVLTAAHCIDMRQDASSYTVQLGIARRRAHSNFGQKAKVKRIIAYPLHGTQFDLDYDIALLQLQQRVYYHEHIRPVCLPPADQELQSGTNCTVIGWAKRGYTYKEEYDTSIKEVQVNVFDHDVCKNWLGNKFTRAMICAGNMDGGKDACKGDSGGPLLCPIPGSHDRWFVGGIVSWGIECAQPGLPGVYANVSFYVPWIKRQIELYSN